MLGSTRTKNVIWALEEFIETYYGPPLLLTTDRGPQFSRSNNVIRKWATDVGINHKLSSAYSPQSNGEAEQAVKRIKAAIVHSDGTQPGITLACHTLKWEQQPDKTRSPAELFLNRPPRFPGLPTIPHKIIDNSDTKKRREDSRVKQMIEINKGLRKPKIFQPGDTVYLRDQEGRWKLPATVKEQRKHQGFDTLSYVLKNLNTGTTTTRNERDIRKFPGNANQTADTPNTPADTDKVITRIMKQDECMKAPESGAPTIGGKTDRRTQIIRCISSACKMSDP